MSDSPSVVVDMRIPGKWAGPKELLERLPKDCQLTPDHLILSDGVKIEFGAVPADKQFPHIFRTSLRQPASDDELATVDAYTTNILLSGPGGSRDAALAMMRGAAAIISAGGAGVFIDNCGLSHGGEDWLVMTEDGSPDAISFAFVSILRGQHEVYTMGLHVLGLRDIAMKRDDIEVEGFDIVEVIRYLARGDKPMADHHVIADTEGTPRFQAFAEEIPKKNLPTAMHNPFGRLKLVSMRDIAEGN